MIQGIARRANANRENENRSKEILARVDEFLAGVDEQLNGPKPSMPILVGEKAVGSTVTLPNAFVEAGLTP